MRPGRGPACALALMLLGSPLRAAVADEPAQPAAPDDSEGAAEVVPIDVSVRGQLEDVPPGSASMSRAETRALPGAFGDPFRAIEVLPGIAPLASGIPFFYVRGSPPGNIGYFLDGIRVPLLFHLGLGPSVIHPGLVERVDLVPGGDPELGRFAGGAVTSELARPWSRPHAEGSLRAVDTGALVEIPWDDGEGSVLAAGRFSYTALLFSLLSSATVLDYWDYAGRVSATVSPGHKLTLFGFGAHDALGEKAADGTESILFDTTFHRLDVRYDVEIDRYSRARYDVILGYDQTLLPEGRYARDKILTARGTVHHGANEWIDLALGFDVTADAIEVDLTSDEESDSGFEEFFAPRTDVVLGAFASARIRPTEDFTVSPALRFDTYMSGRETAVALDPGLALRVQVAPWLAVVQRNVLASQMPSFIVAGPGFRPGLDQGGLQRAYHASLGAEISPGDGWDLVATLYRIHFFELNDALGTTAQSGEAFPDGFESFDERAWGTSTGLELSARRRLTKAFGAMLAYSLGRSERSDGEGTTQASGFDRTHVASAAVTYDFGEGFRGGLRQLFYSGAPAVVPRGIELVQGGRLPPFYRVDWRFEKRFDIGETGYLTLVAELLNSFFATEVIGQVCDYDFDTITSPTRRCKRDTLGPVSIPSIGVEGGF